MDEGSIPEEDHSLWRPLLIWCGLPLIVAALVNVPNRIASVTDPHILLFQAVDFLSGMFIAATAIVFSLSLAWSPGHLFAGLAIYWVAVVACLLSWTVGSLSSPPYVHLTRSLPTGLMSRGMLSDVLVDARQTLGLLPIVLFAVQLPFWTMRIAAGWKLTRQPRRLSSQVDAPRPKRESLSISDFLVGITYVAVMLGCLRLLSFRQGDGLAVVGFLVFSAGAAIALFVTALPVAWLFLRPFNLWQSWAVTIWLATLLTILFTWQASAVTSGKELVWSVALPVVLHILGLAAGLSLLRLHGWRLAVRGES
jgi:hypothetical protein